MSQCFGKRLVLAETLILQPQAQDDERVCRAVELAVETRHELIAPQDRHRVVAELAKVRRFVYLPNVVKAEQNFGPPAGAHLVKRREEEDFLRRGRL